MGTFAVGLLLQVHTGVWLWLVVLPPLAAAHARAATRGPMHTRATELVNTTVAATVAPLLMATVFDRWSPAFLLSIGAAVWAGMYFVLKFQTRQTRREMAKMQGAAAAERLGHPPS